MKATSASTNDTERIVDAEWRVNRSPFAFRLNYTRYIIVRLVLGGVPSCVLYYRCAR